MDAPLAKLRLIDSITELTLADAGCIAVSGSHGGLSSARYAISARPLLTVFNDAGVGKSGAGVAGLELMSAAGLAACAVSHDTARIGVAHDTWDCGIVSACNPSALQLGLRVGQPLLTQVTLGFHLTPQETNHATGDMHDTN